MTYIYIFLFYECNIQDKIDNFNSEKIWPLITFSFFSFSNPVDKNVSFFL